MENCAVMASLTISILLAAHASTHFTRASWGMAGKCSCCSACVQAHEIAEQAPELLARLPKALRRAVDNNHVPEDLNR